MKKILLFIFILLGYSYSYAQQIDSLRIRLYDFLISKGDLDEFSKKKNTLLIINDLVTHEEFKDQEYGIFKFGTLTSESYTHILLVDKEKHIIVDMHQPFDIIIHTVLGYFKNHSDYTRSDVINYLDSIINLHKKNSDSIPWKIE